MNDPKQELESGRRRLGAFGKASPDLFGTFTRVSKIASTSGGVTAAQKEMIAVAIAVSQGCDDCILYHVDAALKQGVKEADLIETLEVAVEMGGGPSLMYAARALEAYRGMA